MAEQARPPGVDALARRLASDPETGLLPFPLLVDLVRGAVDTARTDPLGADVAELARTGAVRLGGRRPQRIVNATGVILHTNLGRAPLHPEAAAAAGLAATGYGNVEFDVETGRRGGRHTYAMKLLAALVGAESAVVVNNNAAALVLTLAALAAPGAAAVSRGELIEIGGSFRLPELMAATGASLVEVGTTNRTRLADYERVATDVAMLLKVHPSNYRIEGFTAEVGYGELATLGARHDRPVVADIGSGLLDSRAPWLAGPPPAWLDGEPGVRQTLQAGVDLVLFSGDKLLGGPQAGLIAGRRHLVERLASHSLMRALRVDGPTLAALSATLDLYGTGRGGEIPVWRMASLQDADLAPRLRRMVDEGAPVPGAEIVSGAGLAGGGSTPGAAIPGVVLSVACDADAAWRRLLDADPPVLARRHDGRLLVDARTVEPNDDAHVGRALGAALGSGPGAAPGADSGPT